MAREGTRGPATTRIATTEDLPALEKLLEEWLAASGREAHRPRKSLFPFYTASRLLAVIEDPGSDIILAAIDGEPVGMAVLRVAEAGPLSPTLVSHLSHMVVIGCARRKGVGRALVAAATEWGERRGVEQMVAHVDPGQREASRFFARLGFAPVSVRRVATISVLRRQFSGADVIRATTRIAARRPIRRLRLGAGLPAVSVSGVLPSRPAAAATEVDPA